VEKVRVAEEEIRQQADELQTSHIRSMPSAGTERLNFARQLPGDRRLG
jgi:hypothetical protein